MMNAEALQILRELRMIILYSLLLNCELRIKAQMTSTLPLQNNFHTDTKKCVSSFYCCKGSTQGLTSLGLSDPEHSTLIFFGLHLVLILDARTLLDLNKNILSDL